MNKEVILYMVIPCYNEEEVLLETTKRLKEKYKNLISNKLISKESKILYVDDGSKDKTWSLIESIHKNNNTFLGIKLSRNKGHQNALVAGLLTAKSYADVIISMDADLQDDIHAIDKMLEEYYKGNEIVYGVRNSRKKDSWFKKTTAQSFYKLMKIMGVDVIYNHADFRLTSRKVLDCFENYKEVNLFLRGIFPLIGYKSSVVYYERDKRFAGESKYPFKKMLSFACDGITSFSIKPLRMVLILGMIILFISIVIMIYSLVVKMMGKVVPGWTFITISIWFIGGLQMLSIGVIGEYIGKIYHETKQRPRYFIEKELLK